MGICNSTTAVLVHGTRSGHTSVTTLDIEKVLKGDGFNDWEAENCTTSFSFPHKGVVFIACEEKNKPESNNLILVALSTIISDVGIELISYIDSMKVKQTTP